MMNTPFILVEGFFSFLQEKEFIDQMMTTPFILVEDLIMVKTAACPNGAIDVLDQAFYCLEPYGGRLGTYGLCSPLAGAV